MRVGSGEGFARERKAQIAFQPEAFRGPFDLDQPGEACAHLIAFRFGESVQKIAEGARFRPFQQGICVGVDVDQGSQVAAVVNEPGSCEQLLQLFVRRTQNRMGFVMPIRKARLQNGFTKQSPGLVRPGRVLNIQSQPATRLEDVRSLPEFGPVRHKVWSALREEVLKAQQLAGGAGAARASGALEDAAHV